MPRALRDFTPIYADEEVPLSFDFGPPLAQLPGAQTLVSPTWSIGLVLGSDATPAARLLGPPSIIGTFVTQMVGTYQPGSTYDHIAKVTTSGGEILETNAHQSCPNIE
jgi:hypothetical protein